MIDPRAEAALKAYKFALRQEDRYLGSVFATPHDQRDIEAKLGPRTSAARR